MGVTVSLLNVILNIVGQFCFHLFKFLFIYVPIKIFLANYMFDAFIKATSFRLLFKQKLKAAVNAELPLFRMRIKIKFTLLLL